MNESMGKRLVMLLIIVLIASPAFVLSRSRRAKSFNPYRVTFSGHNLD